MNNIEIIKQLFANYAKADFPAVFAAMDDAVVWNEPGAPGVPFAGIYKGKQGVQEMFGKEHAMVKVQAFNITGFLQNENQVAVVGNDTTQVIATQKVYSTDWVMLFTLNAGLIVSVETYMETEAVARAFQP